MRRPIDWLLVALSCVFLGAAGPTGEPGETRTNLAFGPEVHVEALSFEAAGPVAVPASLRRARNLEFGYVNLD